MPKGFFDRVPTIHGHAQMMERLEQRAKGKVMLSAQPNAGSHVDAGDASAENTPLEWLPRAKGVEAILSGCGRYSVSRAAVSGNFCYTAWSRLPSPTQIGDVTFAADLAKDICQAHSQGATL